MENTKDIVVFPVDIGWTDVDSWGSLFALLEANESGNIASGPHMALVTRNSLILGQCNGRITATIGAESMVNVDTDNALLICPKDREQEVRAYVHQLLADGRARYL
ncbi:MAG: hypothetical protein WA996_13915 [Candidatus Promineifilaceae bacterium]